MEARLIRAALLLAVAASLGAAYRSANFVVSAPAPEFAQQVAQAAEQYRLSLAQEWLGHELPRWSQPCPIVVRDAPHLGAGGVTSFMFEGGIPFGWRMSIQGSRERILDSVLPHEVTHTIFATHFGRPLPRWADEGACTTVEHTSERTKHYQHLYQYLTTQRGIAFNQMFAMTEYPLDIMPLYAQGHSVVEYLLLQGGRQRFVGFLGEGMKTNDWDFAVRNWYAHADLSELQVRWVEWLRQGRPSLSPTPPAGAADPTLLADSSPVTVRGQTGAASSAGSWYARHRERTEGPTPQAVSRSMTRAPEPQPFAGSILQWDRNSAEAANGTTYRR